MNRKKRKTREKKHLKSVLWKERWRLAAVALILMLVVIKFTGQQSDEPTAKSDIPADVTNIKLIEITTKTQNIVWPGSDPALGHDLGHKDVDGSWASEEGSYGYLVLGPYANLAVGSYKVLFELKVDSVVNKSNLVGTIEITQDRGTKVLSKDLYGKDFDVAGEYKNFSLVLVSGKILKDVEFRVHYPDSKVNLSVKKIILASGSTVWPGNDPALGHELGREGADGTWTSGDGGYGYMVSGPHISLAAGVYDVSYTFVIDEYINESQHIATIDISYDRGTPILSGKLTGHDFNYGRTSGTIISKSFINRLYIDGNIDDVEFKLHYPNSTVRVTLRDITLFIR